MEKLHSKEKTVYKILNTTILITFGMFIIGIIGGCSDDSPEVVTDPSNPTTSRGTPPRIDEGPPHMILTAVDPAPGGWEIPPNTQFSLNFDRARCSGDSQWCCSHRSRPQLDRIADATGRRQVQR